MPVPKKPAATASRRLLRDEVRDSLREAIISGQLLPGERLEDSAIQEWLGVSRTPVRQAIDTLVAEGFIETAAHSYTRVVDPDPAETPFVLGAVGVFISGVTRWAVPRMSPGARQRAEKLAESVRSGLLAEDRVVLARDAVELFDIMHRECGNPVLQRLWKSLSPNFSYRLSTTMSQGELDWERLAEQYRLLAAAIRSGDADSAGKAVEEIHAPAEG